MVQEDERLTSPFWENRRSSVLEYVSAQQIKKSGKTKSKESIIYFRIGGISLDKLIAVTLDVIKGTAGRLHYNLINILLCLWSETIKDSKTKYIISSSWRRF